MEDMPSRPLPLVRRALQEEGWNEVAAELGDVLTLDVHFRPMFCHLVKGFILKSAARNAGTIAQVHGLSIHGLALVLKVTFRDTRQNFETDFRLFEHARAILHALKLSDEKANIVGSMFDAVNKSERSVLAEFDLRREALAMQSASSLLAEWPERYAQWQRAMVALHGRWAPDVAALLAAAMARQWQVAIPEPVEGYVRESALVMTSAAGESLKEFSERRPEEAAMVFLGLVMPFLGASQCFLD